VDRIKIVVASDDSIFQEGLCRYLEDEEDLEVVARTANGEDTVRLTRELLPHLVIMDVSIPLINSDTEVGHAAAITNQLKEFHPDVNILMVSGYGYQASLLATLQAGVAGYMLKKTAPEELISAIRALHAGQAVFDFESINKLIGHLAVSRGSVESGMKLTPREIELLRVAVKGGTNKEIATELGISDRTVQTHMVNIFRRLEVNSRTEAVLRALREGLLTIDDLP
jgi:DNA-binding NarL/FixJ family response regulator